MDLPISHTEAVARVALICAGFALVHSLTVTDRAKARAVRAFGPEAVRGWYRLAYTLVSLATLALSAWLIARVPDVLLLDLPPWLAFALRAVQLGAVAFGAWAFRGFDGREFTGVSQAVRRMRGQPVGGDVEGLSFSSTLVSAGGYGLVRHPLYLAGILVFLASPAYTRTWLVVRALGVAYFVWGAWVEDRRMLARHGEEYARYMTEVPMLIPRIPRRTP